MRRLVALLILTILLAIPNIAKGETPIRLYVNGTEVVAPVPPVIENNRTLVPLRALAEALGFEVKWEPVGREITLSKPGLVILLAVDKPEAVVNGQLVALDVPPGIRNDSTLIPVRFVAEQMGLSVTWDAENRIVRAQAKESQPATPPASSAGDGMALIARAMEPFKQGLKATGEFTSVMGDSEGVMQSKSTVTYYTKGDDFLNLTTTSIDLGVGESMEMWSGTAARNGTLWMIDPLTQQWTQTTDTHLVAGGKLSVEEIAREELTGATVAVAEKSYEGTIMTVVTITVTDEALAKILEMAPAEIAGSKQETSYWIKAGTLHHTQVVQSLVSPDGNTTSEMTYFYSPLNGPIPFPAEIAD